MTSVADTIQDLVDEGSDLSATAARLLAQSISDLVAMANAIDRLMVVEEEVHKMYPNTATCRSGPGIVSGQAFTKHCGVSCSNSVHADSAREFRSAVEDIKTVVKEIDDHY